MEDFSPGMFLKPCFKRCSDQKLAKGDYAQRLDGKISIHKRGNT